MVSEFVYFEDGTYVNLNRVPTVRHRSPRSDKGVKHELLVEYRHADGEAGCGVVADSQWNRRWRGQILPAQPVARCFPEVPVEGKAHQMFRFLLKQSGLTSPAHAAAWAGDGARVSLLAAGAIALGVFFLAQASGCASVRTRIAGGPFAVLTARALGTVPRYVTVWDERKAPDGSWRWRASSGAGHEYLCALVKGAQTARCGGYYLNNSLNPLQN